MEDIKIIFSLMAAAALLWVLLRFWFSVTEEYYDDHNVVFFKVLGILLTAIVSSIFYLISVEVYSSGFWIGIGIIVVSCFLLIISVSKTFDVTKNSFELASSFSFTIMITTFTVLNLDPSNNKIDSTLGYSSLFLLCGSVMLAIYSELRLAKYHSQAKKAEEEKKAS